MHVLWNGALRVLPWWGLYMMHLLCAARAQRRGERSLRPAFTVEVWLRHEEREHRARRPPLKRGYSVSSMLYPFSLLGFIVF